MKKILIIAFLILGSLGFAKAQTDYCKDIIKQVDVQKEVTRYTSPGTFLRVGSSILNGSTPNLHFFFVAYKHTADYNAGGIYVTFADGTIWKDEGSHVNCSYENTEVGYRYGVVTAPEDDQLILFKTKKIVKVQITNIEIPVTDEYATKFMAYVKCIDDIKK